MKLKLNVKKGGLALSPNELENNGEFQLNFGHIFRGAATPSGDPMHSAYEAIGAKWNADTGYWEYYDMKDITNAEMSKAYARGSWYVGASSICAMAAYNEESISAVRFNIPRTGPWNTSTDLDYFAQDNKWIEFINLTTDSKLAIDDLYIDAAFCAGSFSSCENLRRIYGEIKLTNTKYGLTNTFAGCTNLEDVKLGGLKENVSFADSPLLSKDSLLYMINNCSSGVEFTITLHPTVYVKCQEASGGEWGGEIASAVDNADSSKGTTIDIASA